MMTLRSCCKDNSVPPGKLSPPLARCQGVRVRPKLSGDSFPGRQGAQKNTNFWCLRGAARFLGDVPFCLLIGRGLQYDVIINNATPAPETDRRWQRRRCPPVSVLVFHSLGRDSSINPDGASNAPRMTIAVFPQIFFKRLIFRYSAFSPTPQRCFPLWGLSLPRRWRTRIRRRTLLSCPRHAAPPTLYSFLRFPGNVGLLETAI